MLFNYLSGSFKYLSEAAMDRPAVVIPKGAARRIIDDFPSAQDAGAQSGGKMGTGVCTKPAASDDAGDL
jgi:hypothetical protein